MMFIKSAIILLLLLSPFLGCDLGNPGDQSSSQFKTITTIPVGHRPFAGPVSPDGKNFYVIESGVDSVSVISTETHSIIARVAVQDRPSTAAITPDGKYLYVANTKSRSVSVIDTEKLSVIKTIEVGDKPEGVIISLDGSYIYVSNNNSASVAVISTASNMVEKTLPTGDDPGTPVLTPAGDLLLVSNGLSGTVTLIATASNSVISNIEVGNLPLKAVVDRDGLLAYVPCRFQSTGSAYVAVVSLPERKRTARIDLKCNPTGAALAGNSNKLYVTNDCDDNPDMLEILKLDTVISVKSLNLEGTPAYPVISSKNEHLFFIDGSNDALMVLSIQTDEIVTAITTGKNSQPPVPVGDGSILYVVNFQAASITVIQN